MMDTVRDDDVVGMVKEDMRGAVVSTGVPGLGSFRYMTEEYGGIVILPAGSLVPFMSTTGHWRETVLLLEVA